MVTYVNAAKREYVIGLTRRHPKGGLAGDYVVAHLFDGTFRDPGRPLCLNGYSRDEDGKPTGEWSIWRGNMGSKGVCKICERRAEAGLDGVEPAAEGASS